MNLVLFACYSYDVVFVDGEAEIIRKFLEFDARAVFSAEGFCWPDQSLAVGHQTHTHTHIHKSSHTTVPSAVL